MKILICGLPGAGKTWLAERLKVHLNCAWYNADEMRTMANDWEFSTEARLRQAHRMKTIATFESAHKTTICDFVCPTVETRAIFKPDILIWLDTIIQGRFEDTNRMFETPMESEAPSFYVIKKHMKDKEIRTFAETIKQKL